MSNTSESRKGAFMKQLNQDEMQILLRLVDESYAKKAWHGPNLRGSIRGIDPIQASWRPGAGRHNIWEIIVHCAYWKHVVRRRIFDERKNPFALKGSNWFVRPIVLTTTALSQDVDLLEMTHRALVDAIQSLDRKALKRIPKNSKVSIETMIRGIASHDVYHAGQIQLLKRLMK